MERTEWLSQMRRNAEALYDRFVARYWVIWGMTVEETHRIYLRKFLERIPPDRRIFWNTKNGLRVEEDPPEIYLTIAYM